MSVMKEINIYRVFILLFWGVGIYLGYLIVNNYFEEHSSFLLSALAILLSAFLASTAMMHSINQTVKEHEKNEQERKKQEERLEEERTREISKDKLYIALRLNEITSYTKKYIDAFKIIKEHSENDEVVKNKKKDDNSVDNTIMNMKLFFERQFAFFEDKELLNTLFYFYGKVDNEEKDLLLGPGLVKMLMHIKNNMYNSKFLGSSVVQDDSIKLNSLNLLIKNLEEINRTSKNIKEAKIDEDLVKKYSDN